MDETIQKLFPVQRFFRLLASDRRAILQLYIFAFFAALVSLSLPLGLQAIVNLIMSGQVTTSFYVLIMVVVAGYAVNGYLQIVQISISEIIQRRIFARAAFEFAYRIPRIRLIAMRQYHAPELINRFFDTLSIQKGLPKILIDFAGSSMQIVIGLVLLSFYHPFFILFGLLTVLLVLFIVIFLGPVGLRTALEESKYKYEMAHWLEELARAMETFKLAGVTDLPIKRADIGTLNYLNARRAHFKSLLSHYYSIMLFKVIIAASFLLLGGFLVLNQIMNIGQFVAAEIIVILLLSSVEKLIYSMDANYEVLTALEKLGSVTDLPLENEGDFDLPDNGKEGIELWVKDLEFSFDDFPQMILRRLSFDVAPGERVLMTGTNGSGKNILLQLLTGMYTHYNGSIRLNGLEIRNLNLEKLRRQIGDSMAKESIFYGTLLENITLGEPIPMEDVLKIMRMTHLDRFTENLQNGLMTMLFPEGKKLPRSTKAKIVLARALLCKPKLILLDENMNRIRPDERKDILKQILDKSNPWTVIAISNNVKMAPYFDRIMYIENGQKLAEGTPEQVKDQPWFQNLND
jgi:ABC-type bacteriocin/lantibiotic exporter with double-glycine peptidase domain